MAIKVYLKDGKTCNIKGAKDNVYHSCNYNYKDEFLFNYFRYIGPEYEADIKMMVDSPETQH